MEERAESARRRLAHAKDWWKWEPHPRQRDFFCATAQVRIAACGRRWGKTACLGVDAATLALDELAQGRACRQLIVAPSEGQARLLGEEVQRRIQSALDARTETTAGVQMTVRRKSGLTLALTRPGGGAVPFEAWVICRTAGVDGAGLRGLWAHRIIVDEAARVPDAVLSDVLLPMLADVGGEYVLASSPFGRRNGFYRLWTRGMFRDPSPAAGAVTYESFQCPTRDNTTLDGSFLESQREEMDEAAFAEEFEAEFREDGGAVFPGDDIDAAQEKDPRVVVKNGDLVSVPIEGRLYSAGIDWARKRDYSVLCVLDVTDLPARVVSMQRWRGTTWNAQVQTMAQTLLAFHPVRVLADGTAMGDTAGEMLQTRLHALCAAGEPPPRIEQFQFSLDSKRRLIDRLTVGLSAQAVQFPPFRILVNELRIFEYGDVGPSGRAKMAAAGGGQDDCVIALALAWYAAPAVAPCAPGEAILLGSQAGQARRD